LRADTWRSTGLTGWSRPDDERQRKGFGEGVGQEPALGRARLVRRVIRRYGFPTNPGRSKRGANQNSLPPQQANVPQPMRLSPR
jgi:hypothetical protein